MYSSRLSQIPQTAIAAPARRLKTVRDLPSIPMEPSHLPCSSLTPLPLSSRCPSVDSGLTAWAHSNPLDISHAVRFDIFSKSFESLPNQSYLLSLVGCPLRALLQRGDLLIVPQSTQWHV